MILQQLFEAGPGGSDNYAENLAQQIFDKRQDISSEEEVLNQAYHIVANDMGQKTARYKFNYDADFPSDVVSNYFHLQKQGVAEGQGHPSDNDIGTTTGGTKMSLGQWKQMWMKKMPNADFASMFKSPPNMQGSAIAYFDGWMNNPDARWDPQQGVAEAAKWRSHPDAYDADDEGNKTPRNPNSPKFGYDPLQRRADTANDAKTPRGKTAALKTSLKMAKGNKGVAEGAALPPEVIELIKKIAQSSATPEHKKAMIDALVAKHSKQGVAEGHDSEDLANEVYAEFERTYPNLARRADERTIHAAIMDVLNYGGDNNPGALAQDVARAVKQDMQQGVAEGWSQKYKSSINCSHPKGFSQKAHCAGKKKHNESIEMEMTCPDCGMCETHINQENLDEACWKGYHKEGNKKMFGKTYPNCVKNEGVAEGLLGSDPNRGQKVPDWAKRGIVGKIGQKLDTAWSDVQMTVPQHLLSKQSSVPATNSLATKNMPKATSITPTRAIPQSVGTKLSQPAKNVVKTIADKQDVAEEKCPHCNGPMFSEMIMNEKKDACYYKVKSRYKVWPSAYASGALVKCRNKGASNWGNGGKKNESSILEGIEQADESLHDWFNKEKWVRMDTKGKIKGPCAREPGEGKPKCLPQSKAHSLGKKGRASAAARKRREDPNPERSGKAINVNTKKKD